MKKKYIALILALLLGTAQFNAAHAASVEVYGETKMNIWDYYLTENNEERPDAISGVTPDAISQATYNPYDNLPLEADVAMDFDLLADVTILDALGIRNTSITKILNTWNKGYETTLLGSVKKPITYEIEKKVVKYTDSSQNIYYIPYEDFLNALSINKDFSWDEFAAAYPSESYARTPYMVKFILETGEFGRRTLVSESAAKEPPVLTLDNEYINDDLNKGQRIKLDFENNKEWAESVYAIKLNGTGLIAGETGNHAGANSGETSFLKGSAPADKKSLIIRLSQKFKLGNNKLTFMAKGYKDAVFNLNIDVLSKWMVNVTAKNEDSGISLQEESLIRQGDTIRIEGMSETFGSIWIDGKKLPDYSSLNGTHLLHYDYDNKILRVYTNNLAQGSHVLTLKAAGHDDVIFNFEVDGAAKLQVPALAAKGEQLDDGQGGTYGGGIIAGSDIVLESVSNIESWGQSILRVLMVNNSTGKMTDITETFDRSTEGNIFTIKNNSMNLLRSSGSYTLTFQTRGYEDVSIPLKLVKAMPQGNFISYREADGSVLVFSKDSLYMSKDNIIEIQIGNDKYPVDRFLIEGSYSAGYTMTIPSEYFEAGANIDVRIVTKSYSDFIKKISIPATHKPRISSPEVLLQREKIIQGDSIVITFSDDEQWRNSIISIQLQKTGSSYPTDLTGSTVKEPGKLTMATSSYLSIGDYSLLIKAVGYKEATVPLKIVYKAPTDISFELLHDGSVSVKIPGSTYRNKITSVLAGNTLLTTQNGIEVTSDGIILQKEYFAEPQIYTVAVQADGYVDYEFTVDASTLVPPVLSSGGQITEKTSFKINFEGSGSNLWKNAITQVQAVKGYTAVTFRPEELSFDENSITFPQSSSMTYGNYTFKIYAEGYRTAQLEVTLQRAVPSGISYEWMVGDSNLYLKLDDYTYRNALEKITIGDNVLSKGNGFSINDSRVVIKGEYVSSVSQNIVLHASGYADYSLTVKAASDLPNVKLPEPNDIIIKSSFTVTPSGIQAEGWISSVTKAEIVRLSSTTEVSRDKLIIDHERGTVTIPGQYMPSYSGSGTIKVYADGYKTLLISDVRFLNPSPAISKTAEWLENGSLQINVGYSSYSYFKVNEIYVDGTKVGSFTKPSYSAPFLVTIPGRAFAGLEGKSIEIRMCANVSEYYPDQFLTVTVPRY